jgi:hypothetical protein
MPKLWIFILTLAALSFSMTAQEDLLKTGYENGTSLNVLYRTERMGKFFGTPRGYGFMFRHTKHITAKRRSYYDIEFQNLRHPKERKVEGGASTRKRYVYGKLNNVFVLRSGFGFQHVLFAKADLKAVEVRYSYSIGPILAFAKPYYLEVYSGSALQGHLIKFDSDSYNPASSVTGRAAFGEGLDEIKIHPGASAKFNLSFEYAPYTNLVRAIETGICLDYYPQGLTIMARNPTEYFIITFNVGFVFGRKWF